MDAILRIDHETRIALRFLIAIELVERELAIRLRIGLRRHLGERFQAGMIGITMFQGAKQRHIEELVRPHVEPAERNAGIGAELRPERLGIADRIEIAADLGAAPGRLIGHKFVIASAFAQGRGKVRYRRAGV